MIVEVNIENVQGILIEFQFRPGAVAGVLGIPALAFFLGCFRQIEPSVVENGEQPLFYYNGVVFHCVGKNDVVFGEELHQLF